MKPTVKALLVALFSVGELASSALAQGQPPMMFEGDMVRGRPQPGESAASCVLASQFKRKDVVVWRIRVLDAQTGTPLDNKALKSVQVELPDGQKFTARFGPHPKGKPTDEFWATAWEIPEDYPTGTLVYTVTAVDLKGRSATWQPFKVEPSQLTVIP